MGSDTPATAEGDLARTPFAHLLVYAVDRRLTGALFLCEPARADGAPVEHVVRFARGTPVKVRPGDGFARLGELLVEAGALTPETLTAALATKGLLGDVLLLAGCVDRDRLEAMCEAQFRKRMTRLFTLPVETKFRYCDGHIELLDYGGEPASADPLAILWAGLKTHGGTPAIVDATLSRLGDTPLRIHPQATVTRLGLAEREKQVIDHLLASPEALRAIAARELLPIEQLRELVYALAITRQLDLGSSAPPVGALEAPRSSTTFARLQLKPTTHRMGAAAPDVAGDGERGASSSKPTTGPRKPIMTPLATPRLPEEELQRATTRKPILTPLATPRVPEEELPQTAIPKKATADDRETLRSAGSSGSSMRPRPVSVEVIDPSAKPAKLEIERRAPSAEPPVVEGPPSALRGLSPAALLRRAEARLLERDLVGAEEACSWARRAAPEDEQGAALHAWIRAQHGGADVKALTIELDELLGAAPDHRNARFYRAMLRKRLGDNTGAVRDLRRLLEATPTDAEATKALSALEGPAEKPKSSLLGWLFKR